MGDAEVGRTGKIGNSATNRQVGRGAARRQTDADVT
jgi:hypothetical protein